MESAQHMSVAGFPPRHSEYPHSRQPMYGRCLRPRLAMNTDRFPHPFGQMSVDMPTTVTGATDIASSTGELSALDVSPGLRLNICREGLIRGD